MAAAEAGLPKRVLTELGRVTYLAIKRKPTHWREGYKVKAVCEISGCDRAGLSGNLVFDHCHDHGWVRGLVCASHNSKIGHIESVIREGIGVDLSGTPYADFLSNCHECPPWSERVRAHQPDDSERTPRWPPR